MENQLQKTTVGQLAQTLAPAAFSQKLLQCLIELEIEAKKSDAKMELVLMTNELMPAGKANMAGVIKYPMIKQLVQTEGKKKMLAVLGLLVKDFCSSVNVVRNMNEDQMIEAASMLLEECGNFRLEDYVMMFAMAKKGQFHPEVKIYDRVDIQLISSILDVYWERRQEAGRRAQEEEYNRVELGMQESEADRKALIWDDKKGYVAQPSPEDKVTSLGGAIGELKSKLMAQGHGSLDENAARNQITQNPNYNNPYPKPKQSEEQSNP